jgi:ACS family tartrate transporter-like MFS transporter
LHLGSDTALTSEVSIPEVAREHDVVIASGRDSADGAFGDAVLAKVTRRLVPFLFLLYVINYIDRANLSFAKASMQADLKLSDSAYGRAAGVFFLGYAAFEVPSNLALARFGARRWIARIVITWGIIAAMMAAMRGPTSLSVLRFLLGSAEAGFMPGIILYLSCWLPARQRAGAFGLFLTATALSGMIGSPLSAQVLRMDGVLGLHGWQWLYLLEGLPCVPLGLFTLYYLPDRPGDAKWLTGDERKWLEARLRADPADKHDAHTIMDVLGDARVWVLTLLYFFLICGLFGFIYWAPSLITDHAHGFITAIPFCVGAIAMVIIGRHSDRTGERYRHVAACSATAGAGIAATVLCPNTPWAVLTLSVAAIGVWGCLGPFWALPTAFLRGRGAAAGIALINSIGCTAGFITPIVIGWIKDHQGGYAGLYFVAGALGAGAVLALALASTSWGRTHASDLVGG